jgi:phosphoglycolate phosphatase-like HAD superfamily hydrolase
VCETEFGAPNGTARLHFAGRTDPSIVRDFFEQHRIEPSTQNFGRFFDRYVFWLDQTLGQLAGRVLPGVAALLHGLQAQPRPPLLGLLTGNIRLGAELKLRHYRLWDHFLTGGFGDDHEDRNEIAAIVRERASRVLNHRLRGEEIVVIGDTPRDIACAQAIEAKALAVATGAFRKEQLQEHQPTWTVEDLNAVRAEEIVAGRSP